MCAFAFCAFFLFAFLPRELGLTDGEFIRFRDRQGHQVRKAMGKMVAETNVPNSSDGRNYIRVINNCIWVNSFQRIVEVGITSWIKTLSFRLSVWM